MYYYYGTGTSYDAEGKGQPTNLQHVGARIDYAVASNLNVYGVFSTAWRDQPNAYRLGGNLLHTQEPFNNDSILDAQLGDPFLFAVPDHARDIGWEVDLGVNWKLLENLTWNSIFAFWKPGNWWSVHVTRIPRLFGRLLHRGLRSSMMTSFSQPEISVGTLIP